jgi:HEAT repeat protein
LAAAGDAQHPPLEFLFCALESPRVAQRLAAARALGRVKNPAVARRLGHYVLENVSRHEALVALLARRDRFAADFIEQARDDLRLMAVVEAAEGQLNSFANQAWR